MLELLAVGIFYLLGAKPPSDGNMIDNEIEEDNQHRMHFVFKME